MIAYVFPPAPQAALPIRGQDALYPVRRIFCVGRNYAEHAAEMGNEVDREAPFYFTKAPAALAQSGAVLAYPPGTADYHHEVELVLAIGAPLYRADRASALAAVWGYAVGLDMTRRDLQAAAKEKRRPWDTGKDFEGAAVIAPLTPVAEAGDIAGGTIRLTVNGALRQEGRIADMVHDMAAILVDLSRFYHLGQGDIVMTGTPAGVGAVGPGDVLEGQLGDLSPVRLTVGPPA